MSGVQGLLSSGGTSAVPTPPKKGDSPRSKGLKQGLFIFLLSFLIVPLVVMATIWSQSEPFAVVVVSVLLTVGGLLRAVYALLFQSPDTGSDASGISPAVGAANNFEFGASSENYLPPRPANWADTNELVPRSVTDETTKLLQKNR